MKCSISSNGATKFDVDRDGFGWMLDKLNGCLFGGEVDKTLGCSFLRADSVEGERVLGGKATNNSKV